MILKLLQKFGSTNNVISLQHSSYKHQKILPLRTDLGCASTFGTSQDLHRDPPSWELNNSFSFLRTLLNLVGVFLLLTASFYDFVFPPFFSLYTFIFTIFFLVAVPFPLFRLFTFTDFASPPINMKKGRGLK